MDHYRRDTTGRFATLDARRGDAGQVLDDDVATETSHDGGLTIERTHHDGSTSTERKGLMGRMSERTWPDGTRVRDITKKRYVTDHDGDVTDVCTTRTSERWEGGSYSCDTVSEESDGTRWTHSVQQGPSARHEEWDHGWGESTSLDIAIEGDMVRATWTSGSAITTSTRPLADLGDDPLVAMSRRVRAER